MSDKMKGIIIIFCAFLFAGCAAASVNTSIKKQLDASKQIQLGDSKEKVISILEPTRCKQSNCHRLPDVYKDEKNQTVEIYFFRSYMSGDSVITDDEWRPYKFVNGKLVAIGWSALGGPKSTNLESAAPIVMPITAPVIIRH